MRRLIPCAYVVAFIFSMAAALPGYVLADAPTPLIFVIDIKKEDQKCEKDSDCVEVKQSCSPCECYGAAVQSKYAKGYTALRDKICASSPAIICPTECDPNYTFACKNSYCSLVAVKPSDEGLEDKMMEVGPGDATDN